MDEEQPDILAVTETHLKEKTELEIRCYECLARISKEQSEEVEELDFLSNQESNTLP